MTTEKTAPAAPVPSEPPVPDATIYRRRRGWLAFLRDVLVIVLIAVLVSFLVKTFVVRSFYIPSGSMEDTLLINDRILVDEVTPRFAGYERGDIVVFRDPGGWLPPSSDPDRPAFVEAIDWILALVGLSAPDSDDHLVKRLIGLPGDHVVCCNALGQMSVNDVPLTEPYITMPAGKTDVSEVAFDVTVPKNSLWVMGDNRYNSRDSRYNREQPGNGFVPVDNVVGRAFVISWPVAHWGGLSNYPGVFAGVPDAEPAKK
jgi:signal peptidase I